MSHVPFEYAYFVSLAVGGAAEAVAYLLSAYTGGAVLATVAFVTFVVYSYSPLPQGPQASNHRQRLPTWGFSPEYEERSQRTLSDYNDTNGN